MPGKIDVWNSSQQWPSHNEPKVWQCQQISGHGANRAPPIKGSRRSPVGSQGDFNRFHEIFHSHNSFSSSMRSYLAAARTVNISFNAHLTLAKALSNAQTRSHGIPLEVFSGSSSMWGGNGFLSFGICLLAQQLSESWKCYKTEGTLFVVQESHLSKPSSWPTTFCNRKCSFTCVNFQREIQILELNVPSPGNMPINSPLWWISNLPAVCWPGLWASADRTSAVPCSYSPTSPQSFSVLKPIKGKTTVLHISNNEFTEIGEITNIHFLR